MTYLPDYFDVQAKKAQGNALTALEMFIVVNEPAGKNDEQIFRQGLAAVVSELTGEPCDSNCQN